MPLEDPAGNPRGPMIGKTPGERTAISRYRHLMSQDRLSPQEQVEAERLGSRIFAKPVEKREPSPVSKPDPEKVDARTQDVNLAHEKFEQSLISNVEQRTGKTYSTSQRALILDRIESAAHAVTAGSASAEQKEIIRQSGYHDAAAKAVNSLPRQQSVQKFINELPARRQRDPLERVSSWTDTPVIDPENLSEATRLEMDRAGKARTEERTPSDTRGNPEPYRRYAPENPGPPENYGPSIPLSRRPETSERPASWYLRVGDEIIDEAHAPGAGGFEGQDTQKTSNLGPAWKAEAKARPAEFKRRELVSRDAMLREPAVTDFLEEKYGRNWKQTPPEVFWKDPDFMAVIQAEERRGTALSDSRMANMSGTVTSTSKKRNELPIMGDADRDWKTRGDIQINEFEGSAHSPGSPNDLAYQQRQRSQDQGQFLQDTINQGPDYQPNASRVARAIGQDVPDVDFAGATDPRAAALVRGPDSSGWPVSSNPGPLASGPRDPRHMTPFEIFAELTSRIDSDQTGVKAPWIDNPAGKGQFGAFPLTRRDSHMSAHDYTDVPDEMAENYLRSGDQSILANAANTAGDPNAVGGYGIDDTWEMDNPNARPDVSSRGGRIETRAPMPGKMGEEANPKLIPGYQSKAVKRMNVLDNLGAKTFGFARDIQEGMNPILDRITKVGSRALPVLGKGMDALGVAGNVLDLGEMSEFQKYMEQNALGQDPTALMMNAAASTPVLGSLLFNRQKFMNDPAYRDSFMQQPAIS